MSKEQSLPTPPRLPLDERLEAEFHRCWSRQRDGNGGHSYNKQAFHDFQTTLNEVVKVLRATPSESVQTIAVAHPDKEPELFLCCGDGEGTHEFKICHGYEGVAAFYEQMCGRDQDDTLDSLKLAFDDPEEWRNDGTALKLELYCARFYVWKVTAAEMAMPGAVASSAAVRRDLPSDAYQFIALMAREYGPEAGEAVSNFLNTLPSASASILTERQKWQAGIDAARTYLSGSTFGEREIPTVNGCLALLKVLRENSLWGPPPEETANLAVADRKATDE